MVKLQYDQNKQFKITLPKPIVLAKQWLKGDELEVIINSQGDIVLRKKTAH
jgi:bifunctional DNA-binding transcriptional regulator/antitoxin component of YhaV-PrlF toxin-antitoxin module